MGLADEAAGVDPAVMEYQAVGTSLVVLGAMAFREVEGGLVDAVAMLYQEVLAALVDVAVAVVVVCQEA